MKAVKTYSNVLFVTALTSLVALPTYAKENNVSKTRKSTVSISGFPVGSEQAKQFFLKMINDKKSAEAFAFLYEKEPEYVENMIKEHIKWQHRILALEIYSKLKISRDKLLDVAYQQKKVAEIMEKNDFGLDSSDFEFYFRSAVDLMVTYLQNPNEIFFNDARNKIYIYFNIKDMPNIESYVKEYQNRFMTK